MTSPLEARDTMLKVINDAWVKLSDGADWPIFYDNLPKDANEKIENLPYCKITVRHKDASQVSFTGPLEEAKRYRHNGLLTISIYNPTGTGFFSGISFAETLCNVYRRRRDSVWYKNVRFKEIGTVGTHDLVNVQIDFDYENIVDTSVIQPYAFVLDTDGLNFGYIDMDSGIYERTITFTNVGENPLTVVSAEIESFFQISSEVNLPVDILTDDSIKFTISFDSFISEANYKSILTLNVIGISEPIKIEISANSTFVLPNQNKDLTWLTAQGRKIFDEDLTQFNFHSIGWIGPAQFRLPSGLWTRPYQTRKVTYPYAGIYDEEIEGILDQMKRIGFNSVRIPISEDLYWDSTIATGAVNPEYCPDFFISTEPRVLIKPIQILDLVISYANKIGLRVVLDMHTLTSEYDYNNVNKWYTTDNPDDPGDSTGEITDKRNEQQWIDAWKFYANRYKNNPGVCAFDLFNEPWACTWDDDLKTGWPAACERAGREIQNINPNVMIIVEGIGQTFDFGNSRLWPITSSANLSGVASRPVKLNIPNKVIYSPHEYMSHAYWRPLGELSKPLYYSSEFPDILNTTWSMSWGFIAERDIAPVWVGEVGSSYWVNEIQNPAYLQIHKDYDTYFVNRFVHYCKDYDIGWSIWSIDPGQSAGTHLLGVLDVDETNPVNNTYGKERPDYMVMINQLTGKTGDEIMPELPPIGPSYPTSQFGIVSISDASVTDVLSRNEISNRICFFSNQEYTDRESYCDIGLTTEIALTDYIPKIELMTIRPSACFLQFGKSECYSQATAEIAIDNIKTMCNLLEEINVTPVLSTMWPLGSTQSTEPVVDYFNQQIKSICSEKDYPIIDIYKYLKSPEGYDIYPEEFKESGDFLSMKGAAYVAKQVLSDPEFSKLEKNTDFSLPVLQLEPGNMHTDPLFITDSNGDGLTNISKTVTGLTPSLHSAEYGNWQRWTRKAGNFATGTAAAGALTTGGLIPNTKYTLRFRMRSNCYNPALWNGAAAVYFAKQDWSNIEDNYICVLRKPGLEEEDGVIYFEFVAPPEATNIVILTGNPTTVLPDKDSYIEISQIRLRAVE